MHEILLVEDDPVLRAALAHALTNRGFVIRPVSTAAEALRAATDHEPTLVILDLGLPDLDGAVALPMLRAIMNVPVIIATARGGERDVVTLLNAGADDYVVKPFSSEELVARISAVLRRTNPPHRSATILTVGELSIDLQRHTVQLAGRPVQLNRLEFALLSYLAERSGYVVSRAELLRALWRQADVGDDSTIDVHVSRVRRKLGESAAKPRYLHTIRGVGFKLMASR